MSETWTVYIDGASRGNPGPAAYAYVLSRPGQPPIEEAGCLGQTTNNVAEYTALIRALERAAALGAKRLVVHSDSELLVKQINGNYRVKSEHLRKLFDQVQHWRQRFELVKIDHVSREQNGRADQLCNQALDCQSSKAEAPKQAPPKKSACQDVVREEALACLSAAASAWQRGESLSPALVWEQLWSILEENGVLRGKGK